MSNWRWTLNSYAGSYAILKTLVIRILRVFCFWQNSFCTTLSYFLYEVGLLCLLFSQIGHSSFKILTQFISFLKLPYTDLHFSHFIVNENSWDSFNWIHMNSDYNNHLVYDFILLVNHGLQVIIWGTNLFSCIGFDFSKFGVTHSIFMFQFCKILFFWMNDY